MKAIYEPRSGERAPETKGQPSPPGGSNDAVAREDRHRDEPQDDEEGYLHRLPEDAARDVQDAYGDHQLYQLHG